MTTFLVALFLLLICIFGMCFNIIFRKKEFPKYDVGSNEEMRKRGIQCFKDEDAALHGKRCTGNYSEACKDCNLRQNQL